MSSIGSDKARVWARELPLGKCSAKAVMLAIANYVDEDGHCWPSASTLARDTDQTEGNVRRLLKWLEEIGVIVRLKRWRTDHGALTYQPNGGRQTSDEIRLCLKIAHDELRAKLQTRKVNGHQEPAEADDDGSENEPISPTKIDTQISRDADVSLGCIAQGAYAPVHTLEESLEEKKDSPPTPQRGCEVQQISDQGSEAKQWPHSESWSEFERAWQEPILRQSIARNVWSSLTDDERQMAIKAGKGYVFHRKAQKKPPNVIGAHTFLRERDAWPGYAKLVPPDPIRMSKLLCGTDEWRALQVIRRIAGFSPTVGDAPFSGEVPAGAAALAAYFSDGMTDTDNWLVLEAKQDGGRDDKRFIAWRQRAHEWLRVWIEPERIYTEPKGSETGVLRMPDGTERRYRKFVTGLVVPSEWPPAKHGEASPATGPPQSLMTEDDHAVLAGEER